MSTNITDDHDVLDDANAEITPTGSRRNLLKLAAGAAAGGTALAIAKTSGPAAAADTDNVVIGSNSNTQGDSGTTSTRIAYTNVDGPRLTGLFTDYNANIFTVDDVPDPSGPIIIPINPGASGYPAAVGGFAREAVPNGVYGYSGGANGGAGVVGYGPGALSTGVLARGKRSNLEIFPEGLPPDERVDAHVVGELLADETGDLWYCTVAGSPGTWQKIAPVDPPPAPAPAFYPVTPFRVYDSRKEAAGAFSGGENRTISVADSRDVDSYAVVTADAVPSGATAVVGNIVAIGTTDTGFLSINPGGTTAITAASVNWVSGQNIGNAGTFALNATRELEAVFGPGNGAHMTIDITGYYV